MTTCLVSHILWMHYRWVFRFSHLIELKYIYITEIYMKKQYKSSITKNHKIEKKKKFLWCSLKMLHSLLSYF